MLPVGLGPNCSIPNQPEGLPTSGTAEPLLPVEVLLPCTSSGVLPALSPQHLPISLQPSWPAPAVLTPTP